MKTSLWAIKYSVSFFLRTLTESVWQRSHQRLLRYLHIFLAATFVATVIADLSACQPFTHYWQVIPDPGPQCRQGAAHLLTTGILNIVTNLMLIIFPIPMILKSRLPLKRYVLPLSSDISRTNKRQTSLNHRPPCSSIPQHNPNKLRPAAHHQPPLCATIPLSPRLLRYSTRNLHLQRHSARLPPPRPWLQEIQIQARHRARRLPCQRLRSQT